jgi:two-component system cell cycle sensor histidine kinase/response regulator CckA
MKRYTFQELVDIPKLQALMERFHMATGIPVGIIDPTGVIHVATGWQEICCDFHRAHPETLARCRQSDAYIRDNLHVGGYIEYRCKNGLRDLAVPLVIGEDHLATLFLGQFFYADEVPDREFFRSQAKDFGFDEGRYLAALDKVPVFTRDKVGNIMEYYCFFVRHLIDTSLSNRKRIETEIALKESEARYRAIVEEFDGMIYICSMDFRIEFMNERLIRRTGRDATGEYCYKALHELEDVCPWCVNGRVFRGEKVQWEVESPKDGRWYYVVNTPIYHQDGSISKQACIIDVTDRKRAEEESLLLERRVQKTQKLESLGILAGGIAHDFNNILTSIIGNASLARLKASTASPVYSYLEKIETSSHRAADLCNQMLAYSGKGQFNVMRLDMDSVVEETIHLLQLAISKRVSLKYNLAGSLPAIMADVTQIRQIIMNLVINASEAIGEKSGMITITTGSIYADSDYLKEDNLAPEPMDGYYVFLEVSDNGCGMDKETQARIFDPFFTTKFTGRGLGLAAVLGIVRGHKGALKVYSEVGRGTTFRLLLPSVDGPSEKSVNKTAASSWRGTGTVMVVDDEESVRDVTAGMLESFGFQVESARDGIEALSMFRVIGDRIRLVLIDLTMPCLDGVETLSKLRRMKSDLRVILMSGFSECDAMSRLNGKGNIRFIQKPFTAEKLLDVLEGFCPAATASDVIQDIHDLCSSDRPGKFEK